jgi:hypothetical protein
MFAAKVIADSISRVHGLNKRLTTMQLTYPRFIHAELMTHRQLSRNAMSSRAVPVAKMIEQVRNNPAMPVHWGKNQPGMQADEQIEDLETAQGHWMIAAMNAADVAERMNAMGLHKQVANRILEPFQWMHTIVSFTEWDNFESLRCHPAAEPNFQKLAYMMKAARDASTPRELPPGAWHVPYVEWEWSACSPGKIAPRQIFMHTVNEAGDWQPIELDVALKASVARCARVSFLNHDGTLPSLEKDLELYDRLVGSHPKHASPTEHQATPDHFDHFDGYRWPFLHGNFKGWVQHRQLVERNMNPIGVQ